MNATITKLEKRLRVAGILVMLGLIAELVTLFWSHPTAFLFFLFLGGTLIAAGIIFYLYSLVTNSDTVI